MEEEFSDFEDSDLDKTYYPDESTSESENEGPSASSTANKENVKGKKRVRKPDTYKKQLRKKLRNSGKAYLGHKNQPKEEKKFIYFIHTCRYKCNEILEADAFRIFSSFWELGNWDLQTAFISSCVKIEKPLRKKNNTISQKSKSVTITLKNHRVCKDFFLKTLNISNGRYSRVLNRKTDTGFITLDGRGKAANPKKISEDERNFVKEHINQFPKYKSHYCRKDNPNKKYLPSHLNIKKMYQLYTDFCEDKKRKPVKEWLYREIFNTAFNLSFHQPHTDTCNKCDRFAILLKSTEDEKEKKAIETEKEVHQRKAEKAVEAKRKAKLIAQESQNETVAICFDLQKTLPTPCLTTNKVYYLRTLWTYNFGIHDLGHSKAYMYTWDESVASRGSSEVAFCLLKFIKQLPACTKNIIAFSDSCGGQNKNKNILKFWMFVVNNTNINTVDHKFLEPGHTYMECDEDFGLIEKHKRYIQYVFIPSEWTKAIKETCKKFSVEEMKSDEFFSFSEVDGISSIVKKDKEKRNIAWRMIKWLRVEKNRPYTMQFKENLNEDFEFMEADWHLKIKGRPPMPKLKPLYIESPKISHLKWKNLQVLLEFVPPVYHSFYTNLPHEVVSQEKNKKKTKSNTKERNLPPVNIGEENDDNINETNEIFEEGGRYFIESDDDEEL